MRRKHFPPCPVCLSKFIKDFGFIVLTDKRVINYHRFNHFKCGVCDTVFTERMATKFIVDKMQGGIKMKTLEEALKDD